MYYIAFVYIRFKMAAINRGASPMHVHEESYNDTEAETAEKVKKLQEIQRTKSPFFIGTIEKVNRKIGKLDGKLRSYAPDLVIESRASDLGMEDFSHLETNSPHTRQQYEQKVREEREVNQFAGLYAMQSVSLVPSERSKNLAKISIIPGAGQKEASLVKEDKNKPKFVEMHQYPGYDPNELTPLPSGMKAREILAKVTHSQPALKRKPTYRRDFEKLIYAAPSQAVFLDSFWYFFLERFQKSKHAQRKLFNRVAHNYVNLLTYATPFEYKDVFLKDYADLTCQAVYAAFCWIFPDSYQMFNADFKDSLMALLFQWMNGVRPPPRAWQRWNMEFLEPEKIRNRSELLKKKDQAAWNLDWLDTHSMTLDRGSTVSSFPSLHSRRRHGMYGRSRGKAGSASDRSTSSDNSTHRTAKKTGKTPRPVHPQSDRGPVTSDRGPMTSSGESLADAGKKTASQESQQPAGAKTGTRTIGYMKTKLGAAKPQHEPKRPTDSHEALTPIQEALSETAGDDYGNKTEGTAREGGHHMFSYSLDKPKKFSHPACRGPDFEASTFNLNGQSPLVAHYMTVHRLVKDAGTAVLVQHKELRNLPPENAPTYREIIKDSFKSVAARDKEFQRFLERVEEENLHYSAVERRQVAKHRAAEDSLLANKAEVKRLADLLMLDAKRDPGSITAGADLEVERSLMAAYQ